MVNLIRSTVFILGLILTTLAQATTSVTASIDTNPAVVDSSILLTVVADDSVANDAFDSSILNDNFVVGQTSVSNHTSMINFKTTRTTQWTTVIVPKAEGTKIIPAFTIDGVSSNPISVRVLARDNTNASQQNDVFISEVPSSIDVYVQEQFTLEVKLHLGAELKRGALTEPQMTGAEIRQITQDVETVEVINGKRYRVIERLYAIKPTASGKFVLHSSMFDGEILTGQRRALYSSYNRGKPVSVKGKEIEINVKPMPETYKGEWLPSEILVIEDNWPEGITEFELGEPITRNVVITAAGLSEEQLPKINFYTPDELKMYPDQAELSTGIQKGIIVSQKSQNFAVVPTKPGTYTLPELSIPWWNTVTNQLEKAVIPSKTITIKGIEAPLVAGNNLGQPEVIIVTEQNTLLQWVFLVGWILTALAWIFTAKVKGKLGGNTTHFSSAEKQSYLKLIAACKQGNGEDVLTLIPIWASDLFKEKLSNLTLVEQRVSDTDFSFELQQLQKQYYSANSSKWNGLPLIKVLSRLQNKTTQAQQVSIALNP